MGQKEADGPAGDPRRSMKILPEVKRIWDIIAAAEQTTRDEALRKYGREVLTRLRTEGRLEWWKE